MGLFSESVTSVATSAQRVIKDNALPDGIKTGTIGAIFHNGSIPDYVMENLIGGIGSKAERMYAYARDQYVHGLPSGQFKVNNQGVAEVSAVLDALEGQPVTVSYSRIAVPNLLHIGWMKLMAEHGYDPVTNQLGVLTAQKGTPVTLTDLQVQLPSAVAATLDPEALELWGLPAKAGGMPADLMANPAFGAILQPTPVLLDDTLAAPRVRASYRWTTTNNANGDAPGSTTLNTGTLDLDPSGYNTNLQYLQVRYTVGTAVHYWLYQLGAGTYPTLDALTDSPPQEAGTFFPFAYFRYNKASTTADTTTAEYASTKKLLKFLGLPYQTLADAINGNPDIADVEQAMLMMAVPANSTDPLEMRYLFDFFDELYAGTAAQYSSDAEQEINRALAFIGGHYDAAPRSALIIQDRRFKLAVSNQGVYKSRRLGNVGPVGSTSMVMSTVTRPTLNQRRTDGELVTSSGTRQIKVHCYRRQVSSTVYEELQVLALQVKYHIWEEYAVTAKDTDPILLIPLDHAITSRYKISDRELLYARSLHYVFNSRVTTDLAWYETDFFQFAFLAVAVVVTIASLGQGWEMLAAALATDGLTVGLALTILTAIIKMVVVSYLLRLFVKEVGGEIAMILAIIALAYGVKTGMELGPSAPMADMLLQTSAGLIKATGEYYGDAMQGLREEFLHEQAYEQEQWKDLAQANKLLETDSILSPMTFFGETPDQYYNRTVHSGNIGIIGIDAVSNYVERSLSLPTLPERFGGIADV